MKIAILGAGSIGCYLGGALLASGADVVLIGRQRMADRIARYGLMLSDLHGRSVTLQADQVQYTQDATSLAGRQLILVTVKSADTAEAAKAIRQFADPDAIIISFQNGIGNAETLRQHLPGRTVLAGIVPFNVVHLPEGRLHRGTDGELMVEDAPALQPWLDTFQSAHLSVALQNDIVSVQWGKLLLNLNNSVNALSGLPLKQELSQRAYRRCLALMIAEALQVLQAAGIRPAKVARVAARYLPLLLILPDAIFKTIAASMLRIDPEARSSMWDDLQAERATEIDFLNGAVVLLAAKLGRTAPVNSHMMQLIHAAEQGAQKQWSGEALLAALTKPV